MVILVPWGLVLAWQGLGRRTKDAIDRDYQSWVVRNWSKAMGQTDYWRRRTGSEGAADVNLLATLRTADSELLSRIAASGVTSKLEAICLFRTATGVGLGSAKQVVDDFEFRNPGSFK